MPVPRSPPRISAGQRHVITRAALGVRGATRLAQRQEAGARGRPGYRAARICAYTSGSDWRMHTGLISGAAGPETRSPVAVPRLHDQGYCGRSDGSHEVPYQAGYQAGVRRSTAHVAQISMLRSGRSPEVVFDAVRARPERLQLRLQPGRDRTPVCDETTVRPASSRVPDRRESTCAVRSFRRHRSSPRRGSAVAQQRAGQAARAVQLGRAGLRQSGAAGPGERPLSATGRGPGDLADLASAAGRRSRCRRRGAARAPAEDRLEATKRLLTPRTARKPCLRMTKRGTGRRPRTRWQ
jgi:hypothetical protein